MKNIQKAEMKVQYVFLISLSHLLFERDIIGSAIHRMCHV